jgi:hypothetical protein
LFVPYQSCFMSNGILSTHEQRNISNSLTLAILSTLGKRNILIPLILSLTRNEATAGFTVWVAQSYLLRHRLLQNGTTPKLALHLMAHSAWTLKTLLPSPTLTLALFNFSQIKILISRTRPQIKPLPTSVQVTRGFRIIQIQRKSRENLKS